MLRLGEGARFLFVSMSELCVVDQSPMHQGRHQRLWHCVVGNEVPVASVDANASYFHELSFGPRRSKEVRNLVKDGHER